MIFNKKINKIRTIKINLHQLKLRIQTLALPQKNLKLMKFINILLLNFRLKNQCRNLKNSI